MRTIPMLALLLLAPCAERLHAMSGEEAVAEAQQESLDEVQAGRRFGDACGPETLLRGRFYTSPEATGQNRDPLGVFVVKGRVYRLRAANEKLRAEILKRNGQELQLEGAVRNQGTCFIAQRFAAATLPAVALRDRKGL